MFNGKPFIQFYFYSEFFDFHIRLLINCLRRKQCLQVVLTGTQLRAALEELGRLLVGFLRGMNLVEEILARVLAQLILLPEVWRPSLHSSGCPNKDLKTCIAVIQTTKANKNRGHGQGVHTSEIEPCIWKLVFHPSCRLWYWVRCWDTNRAWHGCTFSWQRKWSRSTSEYLKPGIPVSSSLNHVEEDSLCILTGFIVPSQLSMERDQSNNPFEFLDSRWFMSTLLNF